jgi:undecaprenyl-diphosphatase
MELYLWLKAAVMGLVEGATEFIPVSSTGHLILVGDWLDFESDEATFEIFIQMGAILAVLWLFRAKFFGAIAQARSDPTARRFLLNLAIAFMPAAVIGLLLDDFITERLFNERVVAISMLIGGFVILLIERWPRPVRTRIVDDITPGQALGVGLAQCLSLVPGVSRSGATIMGALTLGTSRVAATEFSFFLSIPVICAASAYKLIKNFELLTVADIPVFAIGFGISFLSAVVVVKVFLSFVARHSFVPFAWYRIIFGIVLLAFYWT